MKPKVIIFDMDGLLVHTEPFWVQSQIEILTKLGATISEQTCARTKGLRIDEVVAEYYRETLWKEFSIQDVATQIASRVGTLFQEKGKLLTGAQEAIDIARSLHVPVVLASSSPTSLIHTILKHARLFDKFDEIFSAEQDSYGKPHPGIYIRVAQQRNAIPQQCIAIEDSFFGLLAAKSARMPCIVVPERPSPKWVIADHMLTSLTQLTQEHLILPE